MDEGAAHAMESVKFIWDHGDDGDDHSNRNIVDDEADEIVIYEHGDDCEFEDAHDIAIAVKAEPIGDTEKSGLKGAQVRDTTKSKSKDKSSSKKAPEPPFAWATYAPECEDNSDDESDPMCLDQDQEHSFPNSERLQHRRPSLESRQPSDEDGQSSTSPPSASHTTAAADAPKTAKANPKSDRKRNVCILLTGGGWALVGLTATTLALYLITFRHRTMHYTQSSSSTSPSQFQEILDRLQPILVGPPTFTRTQEFADPSSIPYQTLDWMQNHDSQTRKILDSDQESNKNRRLLDRYVLAHMHISLQGHEWYDSLNFLSDSDVCDWNDGQKSGVWCHNDTAVVDKLSFAQNNLQGPLPDAIYHLNLRHLLLDGESITGTISTYIGRLDQLEKFDVYDCPITGTIPTEIGLLSNSLHALVLGETQVQGTIPTHIGNCDRLSKLVVASNSLTGSIPSEVCKLTSLSGLRISDHLLQGRIPRGWHNLVNLEWIDFSGGGLQGSLPTSIGKLSRLSVLSLQTSDITGAIPTEIGQLSNLVYLHLYNTELRGTIPTEIGNCKQLELVRLHGNTLSGTVPTHIGNLIDLTELSIAQNRLWGNLPTEVGYLTALSKLNFHDNDFTGNLDSLFCDNKDALPNIETPYRDCSDDKTTCSCCRCLHVDQQKQPLTGDEQDDSP
mmetsp:Transcript_6399/g.18854  ORF Transcript_6399/g.18854 Transcript_6399/m.18854 type:complete len:672 (+) Transcript_6399:82-2097(+)|eukprot:CAMPEP_0119562296 /NCGR_PEP_ID=MMETSP1352-20130426/19978_1 /TAXON_ID=265584 /ORGANISM="Stauroneis constricta, Strain CCMP1120" /LENGTH=671 /DNA_ID=CAMNT_0007610659 /DNA_START=67 /DNA_END=2082 /DNA_ORIENTATION=+